MKSGPLDNNTYLASNKSLYVNDVSLLAMTSGNVGIGVNLPDLPRQKLEIKGNAGLSYPGNVSTSQWLGQLGTALNGVGEGTGFVGMEFETIANGGAGGPEQKLHLYSHRNGVFNKRALTISGSGGVGIGVYEPTVKLDVDGNIHATSDICTDAGGGKCLSTAGGGGAGSSVVLTNCSNHQGHECDREGWTSCPSGKVMVAFIACEKSSGNFASNATCCNLVVQ